MNYIETFEMGTEETNSTSMHNVEEGIESWATQLMPLMNDPLSNSHGAQIQSLPSNASVEHSADVCYGMVGRILFFPSATRVFIIFAHLLISSFRFIELLLDLRGTCQTSRQI